MYDIGARWVTAGAQGQHGEHAARGLRADAPCAISSAAAAVGGPGLVGQLPRPSV